MVPPRRKHGRSRGCLGGFQEPGRDRVSAGDISRLAFQLKDTSRAARRRFKTSLVAGRGFFMRWYRWVFLFTMTAASAWAAGGLLAHLVIEFGP